MADNVTLPGGGAVVATDEVTDGTLGTVQVQYMKLMDGAINGTNKAGIDSNGNLKVLASATAASQQTGSAWTSATSLSTAITLYNSSTLVASTLTGQLTQTTTITGGAATFEESWDGGTTWKSVPAARVLDPSTGNALANPYTFVASTNQPFAIPLAGASQVRIRLSTVITGTGSVTTAWTQIQTGDDYVGIAGSVTVAQGTASNLKAQVQPDGTAWAMTSTSANVNVTNSLTVSGTVTANQGSPPWSVSQSGTGWTVQSATNPTNSMNSSTANSGVNAALAGNFDDSTPTSITENNFGFLRMSANRNLYGTIRDAAGNERGVNVTSGNALTVDGSATTQPVSGTVTANQGGAPWSQNLTQIAGSVVLTGTGAGGSGAMRVTVSNDSTFNPQTPSTWGLAASTQNVSSPTNGQLVQGQFNTSPTTITSGNASPLQLTSAGKLIVDGSSVTQPVSGTVTANQGGAPWTMKPDGTVWAMTSTSANVNVTNQATVSAVSATAPSTTMNSGSANSGLNCAMAAAFDDVTPTTITENLFGTLRISTNRNLYTTIRDAGGNERGVNVTSGNALTVDGSATTQPVSVAAAVTVQQSTAANLKGQVDPLTAANWGIGTSTQNSSSVANGVMALAQFNTTPTTITSGNMSPLQMDNAGNLLVNIKAGAGSGGTSSSVGGAMPSTATVAMGSVTTGAPTYTTATANALSLTTVGNLRVDGSSVTQPVSGTFWQATQPVSIAATVSVGGSTSNASDTVATGSVSVPTVAYNYGFNGTQWDRLQVDANKFLKVVAVGTFSTAADGVSTITNGLGVNGYSYVFNGTTWDRLRGDTTNGVFANVRGNVASGSADSGNPVKIGGVAATSNPTAVSNGQRVNAMYDKLGKQVTVGALREQKSDQLATLSNTTETTIVTAGGAGVFNDLYALVITNKSATTVFVDIRDTTGGTIMMTLAAPASDTRGWTVPVDSAMAQTTANTNWTAQLSGAVSSVVITALFVKNA